MKSDCPKCGGPMVVGERSIVEERVGFFSFSIRDRLPPELRRYSRVEIRVCQNRECGYSETYWKE